MAERSKRIEMYDSDKMTKINDETLKLFNKYKIDMELRELSPATIDAYISDLGQWFIYIYDNQGNQSITELTEDDLTEFFYYCKKEGNNSRRMKRRMSSISALYNYLMKKRLIKENPMMFIDRPKKDVDVTVQTFLSKEQVELMEEKLQEYTDSHDGNPQLQTYALFSLSTMARVTAVSNIKWEQIDLDERICKDVLEKEGKIVTLYFNTKVATLLSNLKQYRIDNNIDDNGYVFITSTGNKADAGILFDWAKKVGKMIDVPTLHPHDFRHSGSQLLKLAGCPIEEISELLNHESVDTTRKFYLRTDQKKIRETKDKYEI